MTPSASQTATHALIGVQLQTTADPSATTTSCPKESVTTASSHPWPQQSGISPMTSSLIATGTFMLKRLQGIVAEEEL